MRILVVITGCDDSTVFETEINENQFEELDKISRQSILVSTSSCMPVISLYKNYSIIVEYLSTPVFKFTSVQNLSNEFNIIKYVKSHIRGENDDDKNDKLDDCQFIFIDDENNETIIEISAEKYRNIVERLEEDKEDLKCIIRINSHSRFIQEV